MEMSRGAHCKENNDGGKMSGSRYRSHDLCRNLWYEDRVALTRMEEPIVPSRRIHPDGFAERVAAFIDRHGLLTVGANVLVAVSGGGDSVALLRVLSELSRQRERAYRLVAAHLNHGLRMDVGEDSAFVAELADRLGVPLICDKADVHGRMAQTGESLELAARKVRYTFLQAAAHDAGCETIATAHHADDNVETVLHRILRGTGLEGLRGIRPKRKSHLSSGDLWVVRPLLRVTRAETQAYLAGMGQTWRVDPTNAGTAGTRNRIRNQLLPLLRQEYNPQVDGAIARLAALADTVGPWLADLGEQVLVRSVVDQGQDRLVLAVDRLMEQAPPVVSAAIRAALRRLGAPLRAIGMEHVQRIGALLSPSSGTGGIDLPGGLRVWRQRDRLVFQLGHTVSRQDDRNEIELTCEGKTLLPDGQMMHVTILSGVGGDPATFKTDKPSGEEVVDADRLKPPLVARRWRPGDRMTPLGGPGTRKLSDFFNSAKVSPVARRQAWVVCDQDGIVWVAPYRIASRVRVTAGTRRTALLRLEGVGPGLADD